MNFTDYGRKKPNFRSFAGICLEGLRKTTRNLRIVGLQAEI
jgi:hypothetical protein